MYYRVRKAGTRVGFSAHTLHLVDFWENEAGYTSGKPPIHTEDFETQWSGPHPTPGSRLMRIIERYIAAGMPGGTLLPDHHWSDEPDTHGNSRSIIGGTR